MVTAATHRGRPAGCSLVSGLCVTESERTKEESQWDKRREDRQWDKRLWGSRTLTCRRCVRGAGPPGRSRSPQSRRWLSSRRNPHRPCGRCETSGLLRSWASTQGTERPSSRRRTLNSPGDRGGSFVNDAAAWECFKWSGVAASYQLLRCLNY